AGRPGQGAPGTLATGASPCAASAVAAPRSPHRRGRAWAPSTPRGPAGGAAPGRWRRHRASHAGDGLIGRASARQRRLEADPRPALAFGHGPRLLRATRLLRAVL